jgi:hypothetical protein
MEKYLFFRPPVSALTIRSGIFRLGNRASSRTYAELFTQIPDLLSSSPPIAAC